MSLTRLLGKLAVQGLALSPLLGLLAIASGCQVALPVDQWQRHIIDSSRPWRAVFIDGGDVNGDNLPDIVTGGWWYQNPGSPGGTWTRHDVGGELYNMAVLHDLDEDGDLDILGTKGQEVSSEFVWAESDGHGAFTLHTNLPDGDGDFLQGARAAQIVAGGNPEVVLSWHNNTSTQMFQIPSPASDPWTWEVISPTTNGEQIAVGDIDRDGDLDIHLGTQWLRNDGAVWATLNAFDMGDPNAQPDRVELADIDDDGDLDVVVGAEGASRVVWGEAPANPEDAWTEHVISTDILGMSLDVGDVDQDGDIDVVVGEHNRSNPDVGRVIIYQNEAGGNTWNAVEIDSGLEHHDGTRFVDIDKDGDLDILSIGWTHGKVVLYENKAPIPTATPTATPTPWPPEWTHLSSRDGDLPEPGISDRQTASLILDVDKDGINDFVIATQRLGTSMVWYRRHATGWTKYLIEGETLDIEAGGAFADIDGDGDLDVVIGADRLDNKVWWWENPYPNYDPDAPWTRREIKDSGANKHHDQIFGDFDGDGQTELVFWNQDAQKLFLAEIPLDPHATQPWPTQEIFSWSTGQYEGLAKADVNGDGKIDIVGGGHWFEHNGGTNYTPHVIDDGQTFARVAVGQLKVGGWPEVVFVPGDSFGRLKWYEWTGSDWLGHDLLGFDVDHGHSLEVADIDGNGQMDIFCAEMRLNDGNPDAKMWIFYGDGSGNFTRTEVATGLGNHESKVGDLDGDGDLDIVGKPYRWDTPRVDVWLNGGTGPVVTPTATDVATVTPTPVSSNTPVLPPPPTLIVRPTDTGTPPPTATNTPTASPTATGTGTPPPTPTPTQEVPGCTTGSIFREWWLGIEGSAVSDLTSHPDYPENPDGSDYRPSFEAPTNWADEYGTRMRGYVVPSVGGTYQFWIASNAQGELWLSTDPDAGNAVRIAEVPGYTPSREWDKYPAQKSAGIVLEAGEVYYIEALQKEGLGKDNLAVAWRPPEGVREVIAGMYLCPYEVGSP
jgi:hypothetical protein